VDVLLLRLLCAMCVSFLVMVYIFGKFLKLKATSLEPNHDYCIIFGTVPLTYQQVQRALGKAESFYVQQKSFNFFNAFLSRRRLL
jgi:hypothetical protein